MRALSLLLPLFALTPLYRQEPEPLKWMDGDRQLTVHLQPDLRVDSTGALRNTAGKRFEGIQAVPSLTTTSERDFPVFRSVDGRTMTLPGGVLLLLDRGWSGADVQAFFSAQNISPDRLSPLGTIPNGFLVTTDPGFPSLRLANELAELEGVTVSSPNWWYQRGRP